MLTPEERAAKMAEVNEIIASNKKSPTRFVTLSKVPENCYVVAGFVEPELAPMNDFNKRNVRIETPRGEVQISNPLIDKLFEMGKIQRKFVVVKRGTGMRDNGKGKKPSHVVACDIVEFEEHNLPQALRELSEHSFECWGRDAKAQFLPCEPFEQADKKPANLKNKAVL